MKLSLKTKIIIWFTLFFALLTIVNILFLNSISTTVVNTEAENEIRDVVNDAVKDLVILDNGPFYVEDLEEIEEDDLETFSYISESVMFVIYEFEDVMYGQLPTALISPPRLSIQGIQHVDVEGAHFIIYDVPIDNIHTLRGIQSTTVQVNVVSGIIEALIIISPILILISGVGGYFIIKRSFKPIRALYETAEIIKDQQDYSRRVPLSKSKDEIYKMADMMNQMFASIESNIEREKQFTSNVSHELRTPLAVLKAQLEYLQTKLKTKTQQEDMDDIMKQMTYIETLVEQILWLSKSESIDPKTFETINLSEVLETVVETQTHALQQKSLTLEYDITPKAYVRANEVSLIRVFQNILSNAIKYNKPDGLIHVSLKQNDDHYVCKISDTGIGIEEDKLKHVFEPFFRSNASRTIDDLSLGIGLSMVKRMLDMHGASISIQSTINIGTTIIIIFKK